MKKVLGFLLILMLLLSTGAMAKKISFFGDDDDGGDFPFPLRCVNFSGTWVQEYGYAEYDIAQNQCRRIDIAKYDLHGSLIFEDTIIPDGKIRENRKYLWSEDGNELVSEIYRFTSEGNAYFQVISFKLIYKGSTLLEELVSYSCSTSICIQSGKQVTKWKRKEYEN